MNLIAKILRRRLHVSRVMRSLRSLHSRRGVAAVEFALTLPIWITLLLGASDGTYCMLVNEKTDRIAYTVTDIVTQYQVITTANLADIVQAGTQLMLPFNFNTGSTTSGGVIIITSAYKPAGQTPIICWQYKGGGTLTSTSAIGTTGGTPTLPNGLTLNDNDNVIITEVYYNFKPMFLSDTMFPSNTIYRTAVYKPRLSQLIASPTGSGGSC